MPLSYEQRQELVIRDQFAQHGINYDKATRRFLEGDDRRPTMKIRLNELEVLLSQTVNAG
jgi:hypothetical protein